MNPIQLLNRIREVGGTVDVLEDDLRIRVHMSRLREEEASWLLANEQTLRDLFFSSGKTTTPAGYPYQWTGQKLKAEIGFDTETTLIQHPEDIPQLCLVSVSDGDDTFLLKPEQLLSFLQLHVDDTFIMHNAAFDYFVVEQYLGHNAGVWRWIADEGRMHDTMILDQLVAVADSDAYPRKRNLGLVAKQWAGMVIDKNDPYRLRYAELLHQDWSTADRGFFTYAARDAEATIRSWQTLRKKASSFKTATTYGLLTETLQTQASLALRQIELNGLQLDLPLVKSTEERFRQDMMQTVERLQQVPGAEGLFKKYKKTGEMRFSAGGKPQMDFGVLRGILQSIADANDIDVVITPSGKLSAAVAFWKQHEETDAFLKCWVHLEQTAKLNQFFKGLQVERIYPRYQTLVRTGRTSCSSPNIQQLPREGGFREMVVASPGHVLLVVDYSAVELRTLAAVCEARFGFSRLADIFRQRVDAHSYTAAVFADMTQEDFLQLPKEERKTLRQRAKALGFGVPGGLGAKSLVTYAKQSYSVDMTLEEAEAFRQLLITKVYPELELYLAEDGVGILAEALKADPKKVAMYFEDRTIGAAKKVVKGTPEKADGTPYKQFFIDRVWMQLQALNRNTLLTPKLLRKETGTELFRRLFWAPVTTTTGRRRAHVGFSQARNTPFQGMAADGAKLALWRLYRAGFRTVAFVHDEVVIELKEDSDWNTEAEQVCDIMREAMADVMQADIPIEVEFSLSRRCSDASSRSTNRGHAFELSSLTKHSISSSVGGSPNTSRDARRIRSRREARFTGISPCSSSRARTNRSTGICTHASLVTVGGGGSRIG